MARYSLTTFNKIKPIIPSISVLTIISGFNVVIVKVYYQSLWDEWGACTPMLYDIGWKGVYN